MLRRLPLSAGLVALACVLTAPASVTAAQRFAAPGADGPEPCAAVNPCGLVAAVNDAQPNDEVIVAPGDYNTGATPLAIAAAGVDVHGAAGQPRPQITGATAGSDPLVDIGVGAANVTLRHLALRQTGAGGPGASVTLNAAGLATLAPTLTDLQLRNDTSGGTAARLGLGVTLATSTAHGAGSLGKGVTAVGVSGGPTLRNVTAWGNGGAGIAASGATAVIATNTIARAPGSDGVSGADLFGSAVFVMTHSNFATKDAQAVLDPTSVGNRSANPLLTDPANGDFHQQPGSPTIDAGIADPLAGASDPDGDPRSLGAAQDTGADEYVARPPSVATGDPLDVTTGSGRMTGTVNPNGRPTSYRFDYGATPLYGSSTAPQSAGDGSAPVDVSAGLGDLQPGTIVHYRLVAANLDGEVAGLDRVLVVQPLPAPAPSVPLPAAPPGAPSFVDLSIPLTVAAGQPSTLSVSGRDADDSVNSISIDFDDGPGYYAESACRLKPPDPVFRDNRRTTFVVPYTFSRPGVHTVEVTLGSGGCGRRQQTTRQTVQVTVTPATAKARKRGAREFAVTTAADCRDADALPTASNTKRVEKAVLCLLNQARRANRLKPFRANRRLRKAAAIHNTYMRKGGFFAHTGPGEPPLAQRLRRARYRGGAGENLGAGAGSPYATARGMVTGWMNSPVHRANVLERAFFTVGVHVMAQQPTEPTHPGATYTAEFGTTRR